MATEPKLVVEIWSDVMCPFCYIGKRHFEEALRQFPNRDAVRVEWKSFQLDPDAAPQPGKDVYAYLAERKGISYEQSKQMHANVVDMARAAGLTYNFDRAVIANSFDAHRLSQYAKTQGKGDAIEEVLFKAYFTDGRDVADHAVLVELAVSVGLDRAEAARVLATDAFADAVTRDVYEASQVGARGVPFFVFDRQFAVSGAQPSKTFLLTLERVYAQWRAKNPVGALPKAPGAVCTPEGDCD